MFGDTTRTLILDGLPETPNENLGEIIILCMNDIGVPSNWDDIEEILKIGRVNKDRPWPRAVKITLKDHSIRDQIFFFKSRLRFPNKFKSVRVNKEERKDLRIKTAKLRQAALSARNQGHKVENRRGHIKIDGQDYSTLKAKKFPSIENQEKYRQQKNEVKQLPPIFH